MCGVIGLMYEKEMQHLGMVASRLLKMLEYRGYDSTGAVIQNSQGTTLRKDVGAPSDLVVKLGIDKLAGTIFCGQVRWATFGSVTKENAQPHEMRCKLHFYGAHNGNITNCQRLKDWLISEGHDVKSDNDGEMLVHTVEHFFAQELEFQNSSNHAVREKALKQAIIKASKKLTGSYAAVVVDPVSRIMAAIKAGSSLYIGHGHDPVGGSFVLASSDLASVLQLTRILLPIKENEFAIYNHQRIDLFDLKTGRRIKRESQRSLLKVEETKLHEPFTYFMEQDISNQVQTTRRLISLFTGGDTVSKFLRRQESLTVARRNVPARDGKTPLRGRAKIDDPETCMDGTFMEGVPARDGQYPKCSMDGTFMEGVRSRIREMAEITDSELLKTECAKFSKSPSVKKLLALLDEHPLAKEALALESSYGAFLDELRPLLPIEKPAVPSLLKFIDAMFDLEDIEEIDTRVEEFSRLVAHTEKTGNTVYMLACGSSFHAAKTAPVFFNDICGLSVMPLLPGEFRAQCTNSLRDGDVVIGISQSGETKDLIDVFSFIEQKKPLVKRICILNNTNSTLALEKSHLYIPLFCGPEIAVPATKSFINQILLLLILAIRVNETMTAGSKKAAKHALKTSSIRGEHLPRAGEYLKLLEKIPSLIDKTLKTTQKETDEIAADLFLKPSIHILATRILGIAKEGALKIREIVLNHTEGFEGSEFKHGPNTILGINTVFGLDSIVSILGEFCDAMNSALESKAGRDLDSHSLNRIIRSVADFAFSNQPPKYLDEGEKKIFKMLFSDHNFFASLYANYPLLFITCPLEQDINLTISQINTHKIRGANVYMVAEDNDQLREAVSIAPAANQRYRHGYVTLPRTDNPILAIFSITVVMQVLSLKMSQKKMDLLNRLEIDAHGVHPDVPKNVSKSITVD